MSTQTETGTPQDIGTHALTQAALYARSAHRMAGVGPGTATDNAAYIAVYCTIATTYAEVAKAAAALTTTQRGHGK